MVQGEHLFSSVGWIFIDLSMNLKSENWYPSSSMHEAMCVNISSDSLSVRLRIHPYLYIGWPITAY
jgi:hypothetical protein